MEEEGPRGDMTIQSGLSNSTESIDSMKALTAAIEAANAQVSVLYCEGCHCLRTNICLVLNTFYVVVREYFLRFLSECCLYTVLYFHDRFMDQPVNTSATAP